MPRNVNPGALLDEYIRNFESRYGVVPITTPSISLEKERTNLATSLSTPDSSNLRTPLDVDHEAEYSFDMDASSELTSAMVAALKENWSNSLSFCGGQQPLPSRCDSSTPRRPLTASPPPAPRSPSPSSRVPLGQAQRLAPSLPNSFIDNLVPEVPHLYPDAHKRQRQVSPTTSNSQNFSNPSHLRSPSAGSRSGGSAWIADVRYDQIAISNPNSPTRGTIPMRKSPHHIASSLDFFEEPRTPAQPVPWPESAQWLKEASRRTDNAPICFHRDRQEYVAPKMGNVRSSSLCNEISGISTSSYARHFFDGDSGELWKQARGLELGFDFEAVARKEVAQPPENRDSYTCNSWSIASNASVRKPCNQNVPPAYGNGCPCPALANGPRSKNYHLVREAHHGHETSRITCGKGITQGPKPMDPLMRPARPQNAPDFKELRNSHVIVQRGREVQRQRRPREYLEPPMAPRNSRPSPVSFAQATLQNSLQRAAPALPNRIASCPPAQSERFQSTECAVQTEQWPPSPQFHTNWQDTFAVSAGSASQKESRWRARRAIENKGILDGNIKGLVATTNLTTQINSHDEDNAMTTSLAAESITDELHEDVFEGAEQKQSTEDLGAATAPSILVSEPQSGAKYPPQLKHAINQEVRPQQHVAPVSEPQVLALHLHQTRDIRSELSARSPSTINCKQSRCSLVFHTGFLGMTFGMGGIVTNVQSFGQAKDYGVSPGWIVLQVSENAVTAEMQHEDISDLFRRASSSGAEYAVVFETPQAVAEVVDTNIPMIISDDGETDISQSSEAARSLATRTESVEPATMPEALSQESDQLRPKLQDTLGEEIGQVRRRLQDSVTKGLHHLRRLIDMTQAAEEAKKRNKLSKFDSRSWQMR